tara:strand:+ start:3573 stop:4415 length:843 start_codon:yes stop_codon:yes gene_type:complete
MLTLRVCAKPSFGSSLIVKIAHFYDFNLSYYLKSTQATAMNTVRTLICATFALLVAALVHSYSTQGGDKEKSLSDLKLELEKVRLENAIKSERAAGNTKQSLGAPYINPVPTAPAPNVAFVNPPTTVNSEASSQLGSSDVALTENLKLKAENAKLKEQQSQQKSENSILQAEAGAIQKELQIRKKPEEDRAAEIAQALVMARVKVYDPKSGIIVLDLVLAQNLVTGQVLGIRRGTAGGIIGRIKLGNIASGEIGYADPIAESFFGGPVDVKVGDEIIVIP